MITPRDFIKGRVRREGEWMPTGFRTAWWDAYSNNDRVFPIGWHLLARRAYRMWVWSFQYKPTMAEQMASLEAALTRTQNKLTAAADQIDSLVDSKFKQERELGQLEQQLRDARKASTHHAERAIVARKCHAELMDWLKKHHPTVFEEAVAGS